MAFSSLFAILGLFFIFVPLASAASSILGIDLGTEYIKAVLVKPGIPLEIVLTKDSKRKETAAVAFKPSKDSKPNPYPERLYGSDAVTLASRFPDDVYQNLKPLLGGGSFIAEIVEGYKGRYPALNLRPGAGYKMARFQSPALSTDSEPFFVEELLAMQLQNVRKNAEAMAGKGSKVRDAVITIPAFYTAKEKQAVELAANLAGIQILALVSDGLAVGIDYAKSRTFPDITLGGKPEHHVVFDMGAGSTTATVLKFQSRTVKDVGRFNKTLPEVHLLGTGWDRKLGGDILNMVVVDHLADEFVAKPSVKKAGVSKKDVKSNGRALAKLWKEAERLRQVLSANSEISASIESLYDDIDFRFKFSRSKFEELTVSHAELVAGPIKQALEAANLTMAQIDSIILHGGAIRTPFVHKQLQLMAGNPQKIRTNVNQDESAAFGAGFKGAMLSTSFRVAKPVRTYEGTGFPISLNWKAEDEDHSQKLFIPTSQVGAEKHVSFKTINDFSFNLKQLVPVIGNGEDIVEQIPLLTAQTSNLTVSVNKLIEKYGCTAVDVSTKFSFRLRESDGLPEVTTGSVSCQIDEIAKKGGVVEDVKGFFGFGGKRGDQEPLKNDEEPIVQSSTSESLSSPAESASSSTKPLSSKTEVKSGEPTPKTVYISVKFSVKSEGPYGLSSVELDRIKERLSAFDSSDSSRQRREEALNALEAFTYRSRDLLTNNDFITASTDFERTNLRTKSQAASDWLQDEGIKADREDLKKKLKELKEIVQPIEARLKENKERPEKISALKDSLQKTQALANTLKEQILKDIESAEILASASASSESASASTSTSAAAANEAGPDELDDDPAAEPSTPSAQPKETPAAPARVLPSLDDMNELNAEYEATESWLKAKIAEQAKLLPSEDPVLLTKDIDEKSAKLSRVLMQLLSKSIRGKPTGKASKPKKSKSSKSSKNSKSSKTKKGKGSSSSSSESENETEAAKSEKIPPIPGSKEGEADFLTNEQLLEILKKHEQENIRDEL
ncbi:MAG: Hypoxia up-regulated protein 1 [Trizodia sp. TS-e1964]|nr:MAG: Hypoxia up-regulated protein 1 [Trizodia sp. TS-e1964]